MIWHGANTNDIAGLMYLTSLIDRKENVYVINVSETEVEDGKGRIYRPKALGEIHPEKYGLFLKNIKTIDEVLWTEYQNNWEVIRNETDILRRLKKRQNNFHKR